MNVQRISYYDTLRGLAIILVVAQHIAFSPTSSSAQGIINTIVRESCSFAVPLFLAISGYFIGQKDINSFQKYAVFLRKQLPRVYFPCVIWSLPIMILWIRNDEGVITSILKTVVCMAHVPYYFILVIVQLYLLHPIIRFAAKNNWGCGIYTLNILSVIILNYVIMRYDLPFVLLVGPFVYWIMFYYIGVYLAINKNKNNNLTFLFTLSVLFYAIQFVEAAFLGPGLKTTTWIWSLFVILLFFNHKIQNFYNKHEKKFGPFVLLGRYSFGIYLVHVYVLIIAGWVYNQFPWLIKLIIVIGSAFILVFILDKILPQKIVKYLGLK